MAVFEVYANDMLIHSSQAPSPEVKILEPNLTLAVNSAGSFKFKVPPSNRAYGTDDFGNPYINRLTTFITVKKDGIELWSGRIINEEADFWNNRAFTCEGELAFLNDTSQPPKEYHNMTVAGFLNALIAIHNEKAGEGKQFAVGVVTVTDPNDSLYRYTNFESTMEAIKDKMVNRLGGYLRVRKENGIRYLDYLEEPINTCSQTIEFGKNLLEFSKSWDLSDFATVIIPQGERLEEHPIDPDTGEPIEALDAYLDVSSVNDGSIYVYDQEIVDNFGWIETIVHWDDVARPSNLLNKAQAYLHDIQFDDMELKVSAVDLSYMIGEPEAMIRLFDKVHCISKPHGLDRFFPVVQIDIPIDHPENTTFTLGDAKVRTSLTEKLRQENEAIKEQIDSQPSTTKLIDDILQESFAQASELLSQTVNGYISIITSETGGLHSEKLVAADAKDWRRSSHYWALSVLGFAHYTTGQTPEQDQLDGVAITMDGKINASMITVGTLNAARIKAGVLSDVNGYNYWDLESGDLRMSAGVTVGGKTIDTIATEKATAQLNGFITGTYSTDMSNVQTQLDKKAETWYQDSDPSSAWNTPALKEAHVGDLWYKTLNNENTTWIYRKVNNVYGWYKEDVPKEVFDDIDGKAQIFVSQPTTPYDVGDLWFGGPNSDIKTCITAKESGSFDPEHWVKWNKYTDDTAVRNLDTALDYRNIFERLTNGGENQGFFSEGGKYYLNAQYVATGYLSDAHNTNYWNLETGEFRLAASAKVIADDSTYSGYGAPSYDSYPASSWTTDSMRREHLDETYRNTNTNEIYIWKKAVRVTGVTFNENTSLEAGYDKITIYYYDYGTWYRTKEYSGTELAGKTLWFEGIIQTMLFYFHSDGSVYSPEYWGWEVTSYGYGLLEKGTIEIEHVEAVLNAPSVPVYYYTECPFGVHPYGPNVDAIYRYDDQFIPDVPDISFNWFMYDNSLRDYVGVVFKTDVNQEEVFDKLTNGGEVQGIYMQDSQLYINASYIVTGMLRGGRDSSGNYKMTIDLENGTITTDKLIINASNLALNQAGELSSISSDGDTKAIFSYGGIKFSYNNSVKGTIEAENDGYLHIKGNYVQVRSMSGEVFVAGNQYTTIGSHEYTAPVRIFTSDLQVNNESAVTDGHWMKDADGNAFYIRFQEGVCVEFHGNSYDDG